MRDQLGRQIDYLRVSVTDRCNFRCQYCMPSDGKIWFEREEILSYEEIHQLVATVFVPLGLTRIRLTGGEPLLRRDLVKLVRLLRSLPEIRDLSLSTNGAFLAQQARELAEAGVDRVNISLDTLDPGRFAEISRGGDLGRVLAGLEAALAVGMDPVKLNCVVLPGVNERDIVDLARLTVDRPIHVRFIEFMPSGDRDLFETRGTFGVDEMLALLSEHFELGPAGQAPRGNGPARYQAIAGARGTLGFIHPMSRHFCDQCNRFRLTADGRVKACLLKSSELDIKTALRQGASPEELREIVLEALALKPEWHLLGAELQDLTMSQIGG